MPNLRISVRLSAFNLPLKKALLAASRCGASGIEIDARNELRPADLTDTGRRQLRKMMDDLNLQVSSVRFQTRRGYDVTADLDRRIDATKEAMRMAFQLGATYVVNQVGRIPSDTQSAQWQQLRTVMEDLGRHGAHIGAFLAAETGTEPGEQLAALIRGMENAYVSAALNPGQLIVNGYSVVDAVRSLRSEVGLVVAQDGVQDLARGRGIDVPLGHGTADYPEILGTLEDSQYRGWFVVGRPGGGAAEASDAVQYLTNL